MAEGPDAIAAFRQAGDDLLARGGYFALVEEEVLGQRLQVFAERTRSVGALLDLSRRHGTADLLVFDGGPRLSFAEHHEAVRRAREWLRVEQGVGPGDRVAVCGANSADWIVVALAAMAMGAVVVALNSWWSTEELGAALALTEPTVLLADAKRRAVVGTPAPCPVVALEEVLDRVAEVAPGPADLTSTVAEDDPAVLLFTSGTSGRPKAVTLSHRCLLGFVHLGAFMGARSAMVGGSAPGGGPRLAVFPLFHVSGLSPLMASLTFGGTTVWPQGRFDPGRVIALTREEGIVSWTGATTHISRLLDHPDIGRVDPSQLRQVGIGGSATNPALIARVLECFPHLAGSFSSGYGLTESGALVSYASNAMLDLAPECAGQPLPTVEVKVVDEDLEEVAEGEEGSVCVRSPIVMIGYWGNPEADARAFLPGRWLRTEDVGHLEDGLLHIHSRARDLIIRGGENVYPGEVEDRLERHPDVVEAAVFGVDDRDLGQRVHAAVVLRPGADEAAAGLREHCSAGLAYFKVPDAVTVRSAPLPRNATGKVLKRVLERDPHAVAATDPG